MLLRIIKIVPVLLLAYLPTRAQKKVDPVMQSPMTGIGLPANSKHDKRFLMETSARILLEMESKKAGTTIAAVEVLYLPPVSTSGYNADSLVDNLLALGWNLAPVEGDDKFVWLEKEGRFLMGYFSMDKKETNLYFGEAQQIPQVSFPVNSNPDPDPQPDPVVETPPVNNQPETNESPSTPPVNNDRNDPGFTETRFDDGWVSRAKSDWVEVVKGKITVLLHYPNPAVQAANTDIDVMCAAAWNTLVAPRYSAIQNYQVGPNMLDWERAYFCQANLVDQQSGQSVFVALFKKGNTPWIEVITDNEQSFMQEFGFTIQILQNAELNVWDKIKRMPNYNRFGVKEFELRGIWSDQFASNTFYTNVYTGQSAGMSTYTSSQEFNFTGPGSYKWSLVAANSYGGQTQFASAKSNGNFKMLNDWQIWFSDMEGKPKKYDAFFSFIKGGKILWMNDADYPGSGSFTGYSKK